MLVPRRLTRPQNGHEVRLKDCVHIVSIPPAPKVWMTPSEEKQADAAEFALGMQRKPDRADRKYELD